MSKVIFRGDSYGNIWVSPLREIKGSHELCQRDQIKRRNKNLPLGVVSPREVTSEGIQENLTRVVHKKENSEKVKPR